MSNLSCFVKIRCVSEAIHIVAIIVNVACVVTIGFIIEFNTTLFIFVLYRNLRDEAKGVPYIYVEPLELHDEVLRCNPEAFEYSTAGKRVLGFCPEYH